MWTDSHCHLHDDRDPLAGFARAVAAGVDRVVCIGTGEASSKRAVEVAAELSCAAGSAFATVGLHPHDAEAGTETIAALLQGYAATGQLGGDSGQVVAVGECGLDYHYGYSSRDAQLEAFNSQIELAAQHSLALVVHTREAWNDTFSALKAHGVPDRLVIHCFTGGPEEARRCIDLGAYLSFSGIVTFKNAGEVREAAKLCPSDRLLVETDAPYLAPAPHRGQPNEPGLVRLIGEAVAALREVSADDLARTSSNNATAVFRLLS